MDDPATRDISVAVVFLQPQCNMWCTFCVSEDDFEPLRFDHALVLLDHLVGRGITTVVFGGGEPFEWKGDVVELAREAKSRGMTVQVGTNGVDLPRDFATLDCFDRWVLPLESSEAAVHQTLRRHRKGHHALILERLQELQQTGRSVSISTVLTAVNRDGLPELARFLRGYHSVSENVHAWHLYRFLPLGRGGARNAGELSLPEASYLDAVAEVKRLRLPFLVFQRADMYRSKSVEYFWSKDGHVHSGSEALHRGAAPYSCPPGS